MKIGVIFACDEAGGIGYDGGLPWAHHTEDFKQFKNVTMGLPMIMGSKTFKSLPGVLPGRDHMVITSKPEDLPDHEAVFSAYSLPDAIKQLTGEYPMAWVIGGKRVIEEAVKLADVVRITEMYTAYCTDVDIDPEVLAWIKQTAIHTEVIMRGTYDDYVVTEYTLK